MPGERLYRLGTDPESRQRLARKAAEAGRVLGIHGVSVSAALPKQPASSARRDELESVFRVIDTPTRGNPLHKTVELPQPVTDDVAAKFNRLFGRSGG